MRLLEAQAKTLVAAHGVAVPAGALWPHMPDASRFVVKAQIPEGRRGKRGGILFADGQAAAGEAATRLLGSHIGNYPVTGVYIEERLEIASELYLATLVDRDARCYTLLASPDGGVDVEDVPASRRLTVRIDPLLELNGFHVRSVRRFLDVPRSVGPALDEAVARIFAAAVSEDATLLEINPLAITTAGRVVAADVKMVLDPNATFRHPRWRELMVSDERSVVERAVAEAGGTAVEVDPAGEIVGVVSGAGLMMATLDLLVSAGGRVRCMVDLGGTPLAGHRGLVAILAAVMRLEPQVLLVNAYFQTARADDFARAILEAQHVVSFPEHVLVRLKGREALAARALLHTAGLEVLEGLEEAIAAAVRPVGRGARS